MNNEEMASGEIPEEPGADTGASAAFASEEIPALITALLFSGGETVAGDELSAFLDVSKEDFNVLIEETAGSLRPLGLDILAAAGGYRLVTAAQWDEPIQGFYTKIRKAKLSKSALEVLAVIAYEQPVTRARVDELRQVSSESTIKLLLDRRVIKVSGRADTPGRPFLYKTTDAFLETFGLQSLKDLPPRPQSLDFEPEEGFGAIEDQSAEESLEEMEHELGLDEG